MNRLFIPTRLAALLLAVGAFTASCTKDNEQPKGMTFSVDGQSKTAGETTAYTSSTNSGNLAIAGRLVKGNSYPQLLLVVPKRAGNSDDHDYDVQAYYMPSSSTAYQAVSGNVTLTKYSSSNVIGTFHFTGEEMYGSGSKEITDGKFNIDY